MGRSMCRGLKRRVEARSVDGDVLLCWRFGEKEVGYFHDIETGFSGRRPISELKPPAEKPRIIH